MMHLIRVGDRVQTRDGLVGVIDQCSVGGDKEVVRVTFTPPLELQSHRTIERATYLVCDIEVLGGS